MIAVIIAGGSGTRLWPLSTVDYPKHLLSITNERSLLQNTLERVGELADQAKTFVVTEASHVDEVYKQLPQLPKDNILTEPARRGTASCFIWALAEIKKQALPKDEAIFISWGDHLIRDRRGFKTALTNAGQLAEKAKKLVFIGIEPTYPSMAFNYIEKAEPAEGQKDVYKLKRFVEKPDRTTAEHYLQSGEFLWNTGYLVGTSQTFEREIKQHAPRLWQDYEALQKTNDLAKTYVAFESEPIDSALSEHVKDAFVVPAAFDWMDVGSFRDLHGISHQDEAGNHIRGQHVELENVTNSYVRNEQAKPIAVIGLDNVAVIATKNGILVTNKNYDQKVGDVAKRLQTKG